MWVHQKCEGMTNAEYSRLGKMKSEHSYMCGSCNLSKHMPFHDELLDDIFEVAIDQPVEENLNQIVNENDWLPFKKEVYTSFI